LANSLIFLSEIIMFFIIKISLYFLTAKFKISTDLHFLVKSVSD
jgi:hypothetical protein